MADARFRWVTINRALDIIIGKTNAEMVAFIEELGLGSSLDQLSGNDRTTPKLRNFLAKACRPEAETRDTEGVLISEVIVREAAQYVAEDERRPWGETTQPPRTISDFLQALAVDGWVVNHQTLLPVAAVPLELARDRLRASLLELDAVEAITRLNHVEAGLDEGHWESANGDVRSFLNAVFNAIAATWTGTKDRNLHEGAARGALQETLFFKPAINEPKKSYEGDFVKSLSALLGAEGAHSGSSDLETARFRYALALLTADYFINRMQPITKPTGFGL